MAQPNLNDDELVALIDKIDAEWDGKTHQGAFYSPEGDCAFVYLEDVPYYAQRKDTLLTSFHAFDDHRLVGLQIKNVSKLAQPAVAELEKKTGEKAEVPLFVDELLLLTFKHSEVRANTYSTYNEALGQVSRKRRLPLEGLAACGK